MLWKLHVGISNALEEWLLFSLIEFLSPLCIDGIAHQLEELSAMHFSNTKDSKFIRLMDLFSPVYHKRKSQFASSSRWKITNNGEVDCPTLTFWVEYTLHSIPNFTWRKWLFPRRHLKHTYERDLCPMVIEFQLHAPYCQSTKMMTNEVFRAHTISVNDLLQMFLTRKRDWWELFTKKRRLLPSTKTTVTEQILYFFWMKVNSFYLLSYNWTFNRRKWSYLFSR